MGLRPRLFVALLLPAVVVLAVYGYVRVGEEREALVAEFGRRVSVTSLAIRLAVEQALVDPTPVTLARLATDLVTKQTEIVRIRLVEPGGRVRLDQNLLAGDPGLPLERHQQVLDTGRPETVPRRSGSFSLHSDVMPLRPRDGPPRGTLEVVYIGAGLDWALSDIHHRMALRLGLLFTFLGLPAALALQRLVLRPLDDLTAGIRRVTEGELTTEVPVRRRDELGRLAEAFNTMMGRLDETQRQLEAETARTLDLASHLHRHEALATAGKLCSSIAHEVGTPLNIITGRVELMLRAVPASDPNREDLQVVLNQIDRISQIIRAALDPFRRLPPVLVATDLRGLVDVVLRLVRHVARTRGVTITASLPRNGGPVLADAGQLQQVLINLLLNAVDVTAPGRRVELLVQPATRAEEDGLSIAVTDEGPGIPADVLPRIFDPFFTTKPGGTGIGLAICKDLVQQHGSEITVSSEPGAGTRFSFWLPRPAEVHAT